MGANAMGIGGGWVYQGRQEHGWFGHGTKPGGDTGADMVSPLDADTRIRGVAYGAIGHLPPAHRAIHENQLRRGGLDALRAAMPVWRRDASLPAEPFRARFFGPYGSDDASRLLQDAAAEAGASPEALKAAFANLAAAVQAVGVFGWPRFLADAKDRAARSFSMTMRLYWLSHCRVVAGASHFGDHEDNEKQLGQFSTEVRAVLAIERLKQKPGFRDWTGGFRILSGDANEGGFEEGFASIYDWDDLDENGDPKQPEMTPDPDPSSEQPPYNPGPPSADDVPFWARGLRPYLEETPQQFACRLMDERYGRATWFDAAFAIEEVRNLKKWARADAGVPAPIDASSRRKAPRPRRGGPGRAGATVLYQLHHFHLQSDEDWTLDHEDNDFPLGDYTSLAALKSAINQRAELMGFRDWPGGFRIFIVTLDEPWWEEGFISIHDPAFLDPPGDG